jgi:hypothetical protein
MHPRGRPPKRQPTIRRPQIGRPPIDRQQTRRSPIRNVLASQSPTRPIPTITETSVSPPILREPIAAIPPSSMLRPISSAHVEPSAAVATVEVERKHRRPRKAHNIPRMVYLDDTMYQLNSTQVAGSAIQIQHQQRFSQLYFPPNEPRLSSIVSPSNIPIQPNDSISNDSDTTQRLCASTRNMSKAVDISQRLCASTSKTSKAAEPQRLCASTRNLSKAADIYAIRSGNTSSSSNDENNNEPEPDLNINEVATDISDADDESSYKSDETGETSPNHISDRGSDNEIKISNTADLPSSRFFVNPDLIDWNDTFEVPPRTRPVVTSSTTASQSIYTQSIRNPTIQSAFQSPAPVTDQYKYVEPKVRINEVPDHPTPPPNPNLRRPTPTSYEFKNLLDSIEDIVTQPRIRSHTNNRGEERRQPVTKTNPLPKTLTSKQPSTTNNAVDPFKVILDAINEIERKRERETIEMEQKRKLEMNELKRQINERFDEQADNNYLSDTSSVRSKAHSSNEYTSAQPQCSNSIRYSLNKPILGGVKRQSKTKTEADEIRSMYQSTVQPIWNFDKDPRVFSKQNAISETLSRSMASTFGRVDLIKPYEDNDWRSPVYFVAEFEQLVIPYCNNNFNAVHAFLCSIKASNLNRFVRTISRSIPIDDVFAAFLKETTNNQTYYVEISEFQNSEYESSNELTPSLYTEFWLRRLSLNPFIQGQYVIEELWRKMIRAKQHSNIVDAFNIMKLNPDTTVDGFILRLQEIEKQMKTNRIRLDPRTILRKFTDQVTRSSSPSKPDKKSFDINRLKKFKTEKKSTSTSNAKSTEKSNDKSNSQRTTKGNSSNKDKKTGKVNAIDLNLDCYQHLDQDNNATYYQCNTDGEFVQINTPNISSDSESDADSTLDNNVKNSGNLTR